MSDERTFVDRTPGPPETSERVWRGKKSTAGQCLHRYGLADRSLVRLLSERAESQPDRTWLIFDGHRRLTYREALDGARMFAARLTDEVEPAARVAIQLDNRPELMSALYGAWVAGGTAMLLDPALAGASLHDALQMFDPHIHVWTDASGQVAISAPGDAPLSWQDWLASPRNGIDCLPSGTDPGLVLLTSGSTGRAKGVLCSHAFAFAYGALATDCLGRTEDDVLTTPMPMFHSGGLHVIAHSALHAGCVAHIKSSFSVTRFWDQVAADGATQGLLVGVMGEMLLRRVHEAPPHRMEFVSLSAFTRRREFEQRYRCEVLWQGYGMTEVYPIPMSRRQIDGPDNTLGVPIDTIEYTVLNPGSERGGHSSTGELAIRSRSPGMMFDGYAGDTRRRDDEWFHTGDVVTVVEDGSLRYEGREARRIRRRGENIDPIAVERVGRTVPGVIDLAVFGIPSELGDEDIVVAFVSNRDVLDDLSDAFQANLPSHAVPTRHMSMGEIPRTATGRLKLAGVKQTAEEQSQPF